MGRKPLPTQTLPARPLEPGEIEVWFTDLAWGLDRLLDAINQALEAGTPVAGFEHLTADDAFHRIFSHLEESERAAVFQLLACAEAQLHRCEQDAGPLLKKLGKRTGGGKGDGLVGTIDRIRSLATPSADIGALQTIKSWSEWRDWYAHGRRFEVAAPQEAINIGNVTRVIQEAIEAATRVLAAKVESANCD